MCVCVHVCLSVHVRAPTPLCWPVALNLDKPSSHVLIRQSDVACRYARVDFTWDPSGSIDVVAHFQAVPDVTLSFSSDSMDQTVMAAFVLLVLLTAAQAGIVAVTVWGRLENAASVWKIILVRISTYEYS